jgi:ubiquitin carboxyl-terminal hydrolase L5
MCPSNVWFANQIPDFACATVALINIVNNIPDLELGPELSTFRRTTLDMDPMSRGDAIDAFDFVRRIHNSFASETEILAAEIHIKNKLLRVKRRQAAAKANATKAAKKADRMSTEPNRPNTPSDNLLMESAREYLMETPVSNAPEVAETPTTNEESGTAMQQLEFERVQSPCPKFDQAQSEPVRRSQRQPKPRQDVYKTNTADERNEEDDQAGFHFIAYMPIDGHVWRMDGLDHYPQDMGECGTGEWLDIAQASLAGRMAQYEGTDSFNLMAVVHDPLLQDRQALLQNIITLRTVNTRLDVVVEDWQEMDEAKCSNDVLIDVSEELEISLADLDAVEIEPHWREAIIKSAENLFELLQLRQKVIEQQGPLRAAVRDAMAAEKRDQEEAQHARHDYGSFVREWMSALAAEGLLSGLL